VKASDPAPELDELVLSWYDAAEQEEIHAAIRQGLSDIDAGRGRPAREVTAEVSRRLGLPEE
jgi:predicted transcriptional regulator